MKLKNRWGLLLIAVTVVVAFAAGGIDKNVMASEAKIGAPDMGQALQGLLDQQVQEQGVLGMAMAVQLEDGTLIGKVTCPPKTGPVIKLE